MTREELLNIGAVLLQTVLSENIWAYYPVRYVPTCGFCGERAIIGDSAETIVHAPDCEVTRIQAWLVACKQILKEQGE